MEDSELRDWYLDRVAPECRDELQEKTDPALLKLARQCLLRDVIQETRKPFWTKPTKDALVLKMARSYDATGFLMVKEHLLQMSTHANVNGRIGTVDTRVSPNQ